MKRLLSFLFCGFLVGSAALAQPPAQSTAITYQGHLTSSSSPATGNFDMAFTLFSQATGGNQIGTSITALQYPIANGLFTSDLNFPGAFTGYQL